jgi:hypothetical protein
LEDREAIQVLQVIWNEVYQGNEKIGEKQLMYVVKKGDAVYKMVEISLSNVFTSDAAI